MQGMRELPLSMKESRKGGKTLKRLMRSGRTVVHRICSVSGRSESTDRFIFAEMDVNNDLEITWFEISQALFYKVIHSLQFRNVKSKNSYR